MDDLKLLRDARSRPAGPTKAARDTARAALLERATSPTPAAGRTRALPRMGLRLVAVGGLAVAIAAGVTVAQNLGGVDKNGNPRQVVPGLPVNAAQAALYTAADHAQSRPFTAPRTGQWIYSEQRYQSHDKPGAGEVQTATTPLRTRIDRTWTRTDGRLMASYDHGKLVTSPTGGASVEPPIDYPTVSALPRDPAALLAWAHKDLVPIAGGPDSNAFILLSSLLNDNPVMPPAEEATIYRALAKIPGVTLNPNAVDVAGRPALAVSRATQGIGLNEEILLDRSTYAYRGDREIWGRDYRAPVPGGTATIKKGTVENLEVRIAAGVVDRPGQLP
jgi:hypothetical protein